MLFLAEQAQFSRNYETRVIERTLKLFLRRFFANQFKRSVFPTVRKSAAFHYRLAGIGECPATLRFKPGYRNEELSANFY